MVNASFTAMAGSGIGRPEAIRLVENRPEGEGLTAFAWAVRIEPTADEIETIFQSRRSEPETKIYSLPATHSQPAAKIFRCGECYDIKTVPI